MSRWSRLGPSIWKYVHNLFQGLQKHTFTMHMENPSVIIQAFDAENWENSAEKSNPTFPQIMDHAPSEKEIVDKRGYGQMSVCL